MSSSKHNHERNDMRNIKKVLLVVFSIAALALGGSAIAGAASGGGSSGSDGLPPQRADETLLSGNAEAQVRKAALAEVSGGTIERVETDADGNAAYEAHMVKSDGSRVTVYVNKSFEVVSVSTGR
jgi:uncharacterized membrane protein YkoI